MINQLEVPITQSNEDKFPHIHRKKKLNDSQRQELINQSYIIRAAYEQIGQCFESDLQSIQSEQYLRIYQTTEDRIKEMRKLIRKERHKTKRVFKTFHRSNTEEEEHQHQHQHQHQQQQQQKKTKTKYTNELEAISSSDSSVTYECTESPKNFNSRFKEHI